jgi:hypothetical protein
MAIKTLHPWGWLQQAPPPRLYLSIKPRAQAVINKVTAGSISNVIGKSTNIGRVKFVKKKKRASHPRRITSLKKSKVAPSIREARRPQPKYRYHLRSLQLTLVVVCAGESEPPLICDRYQSIPVQNTWVRSTVVFWACEIMQSFPVTFRVVRAVRKYNFRLVTNETANKWRPVDKR